MRGVLIWIFMVFAGPLGAQGLSEAVLKEVRGDPAPFLQLAADLIHGFGSERGIDSAGVERFVALERAAARATALRKLAVADLDFDGRVTAQELEVLAAATSAKARGRLWTYWEKADADGNREVSAVEAGSFGRAEALRAFSPGDEAVARAVLFFDGDADGWVSLQEVKVAVAALAS